MADGIEHVFCVDLALFFIQEPETNLDCSKLPPRYCFWICVIIFLLKLIWNVHKKVEPDQQSINWLLDSLSSFGWLASRPARFGCARILLAGPPGMPEDLGITPWGLPSAWPLLQCPFNPLPPKSRNWEDIVFSFRVRFCRLPLKTSKHIQNTWNTIRHKITKTKEHIKIQGTNRSLGIAQKRTKSLSKRAIP